jgi:hypothetical protein
VSAGRNDSKRFERHLVQALTNLGEQDGVGDSSLRHFVIHTGFQSFEFVR